MPTTKKKNIFVELNAMSADDDDETLVIMIIEIVSHNEK
jgi:hypothetical protein